MDFFHYCYNVFFILIFAFTVSVCYRVYGLTDRLLFKYSGELMLLYIIESIYQGSIEIFGTSYTQFTAFLEAGFDFYIQIILTSIEAYVFARLVCSMLDVYKKKVPVITAFTVIVIAGAGYFLPGDSGLMLTSNVYGFIMAGLSVYYFVSVKNKKNSEMPKQDSEAFGFITGLMAIFGLLVIVENTNYIFHNSTDIDVVLQFYTRLIRWADDIFSVFLSGWLVWYGNYYSDRYMNEKLEMLLSERLMEFNFPEKNIEARIKPEDTDKKKKLEEFCRLYSLTGRESEIVVLMLEGKSNKEICETLSLSLGTVKVHVHSILTKLSISRRTQLMSCFDRTFS